MKDADVTSEYESLLSGKTFDRSDYGEVYLFLATVDIRNDKNLKITKMPIPHIEKARGDTQYDAYVAYKILKRGNKLFFKIEGTEYEIVTWELDKQPAEFKYRIPIATTSHVVYFRQRIEADTTQ